MTKTQIRAFMAARRPDAKYYKQADSWIGNNFSASNAEMEAAAQAEVDLWEKHFAKKPAWYKP
jgi:hypothetical protein